MNFSFNWKRIFENALSLFFACISLMLLGGLLWCWLLLETIESEDYLAEYQEIAQRQDSHIDNLERWQKTVEILLQDKEDKIEILRTQVNQCERLLK